ncbi:MAG: methyltransferase domain-containing protein [Deltaproteobacteria bacterium]|nr:methyltransferase domain-containing protein [Deltaproteobacteria bacterium]
MVAANTEVDINLDYIIDPNERRALERYDLKFAQALLSVLPAINDPINVLDFVCGDGLVAFELANRLVPNSRLVALGDENLTLERLHTHAKSALAPGLIGNRFFSRREELTRLPFADATFDLVYAALPLGDLPESRSVLTQVMRVLRPNGTIALSFVLPHSLLELAQAVAQAELVNDDEHTMSILSQRLAARVHLPTLEDWQNLAERVGAIEIKTISSQFNLIVEPDAHLDELYSTRLVPLLLGNSHENLTMTRRLLKTAISKQLTTMVNIGVLIGRRPGFTQETLPSQQPAVAVAADVNAK